MQKQVEEFKFELKYNIFIFIYLFIYYFMRPTRTSDAFLLKIMCFVNMSEAFS